MNKMGSMVSVEMDIIVHEIQDWVQQELIGLQLPIYLEFLTSKQILVLSSILTYLFQIK